MKDFNTEAELNDEKISECVESHKKTLGFLKTITDRVENIEIEKYCAWVALQATWAEYIKEYRKELGTFGYMSDGSFYVLKHESKLDDLRQAVANALITVRYLNMQK